MDNLSDIDFYYREAMKKAGLSNTTSPMIREIIAGMCVHIDKYKQHWSNAEARILELEHLIPPLEKSMVAPSER